MGPWYKWGAALEGTTLLDVCARVTWGIRAETRRVPERGPRWECARPNGGTPPRFWGVS